MAALNKLLGSFPTYLLVKYIGSTYYSIVPQNAALLRRVVMLLRQMLELAMKSPAEMEHCLSATGHIGDEAVNHQRIDKNSILICLMNITYSEDYCILRMVF